MDKFIFATHNKHKLQEVKALFSGIAKLKGLEELGLKDEIPETGTTLEENARQKAVFVKNKFGQNAFADDTGLEVDALNGAPGVYSARYAGEPSNSKNNISKLLEALRGVTNRKARFRTVIALIEDDQVHYFEGVVCGTILKTARGSEGFGYDPIFVPDGYEKTFAELSIEEKNQISHRGRAIVELVNYLKNKNE